MSTNSSSSHGDAFSRLGQQEKQVLLLLSDGRSDTDIARALSLGEGTIRNYVHSILSKLELADRDGATAYAQKYDLRGHMGSSHGICRAMYVTSAVARLAAYPQSILLANK